MVDIYTKRLHSYSYKLNKVLSLLLWYRGKISVHPHFHDICKVRILLSFCEGFMIQKNFGIVCLCAQPHANYHCFEKRRSRIMRGRRFTKGEFYFFFASTHLRALTNASIHGVISSLQRSVG